MSIHELAKQLRELPAGPIPPEMRAMVLRLLTECWEEFDGSSNTKMGSWKIVRDKGPGELTWHPPVLSFTIERHGGFKLGSSRAEKQQWYMDLEKRTAHERSAGHRQIYAPAAPFTSKASGVIADSVCAAVREGPKPAPPLVAQGLVAWKSENEVHVEDGALIPKARYEQTNSGRRMRFRRDLESKMRMMGWTLRRKVGRTLNFTKVDRQRPR